MKTPGKIFFLGFFVLIYVLTSGFLSSRDRSRRSNPQYEGLIIIPGLSDSVTVYRDERGIPHIYATNERDLYLATGYISAQERLWQMDLIRRSSTGRLSEIFGKSLLQSDIFTRYLRMEEKSREILRDESPEIIASLQAYTDGVNLFINSSLRDLPLEFRLLSYTPEPWRLEDITNIIGLMGWNLDSRSLAGELFIYQLIRKAGAEKAWSLIPGWEEVTSIAYPDFKIDDTLLSSTRSMISSFDHLKELGIPVFSGSNNWAVSGIRSETGKPLLSNDMHLSLCAPCVWMPIHQVITGKLNVTGVMIPGEPYIIAGHNEKIAWGMTNLRVDAVDLYIEKINPENPHQYMFNGEWKELMIKSENFLIKNGKQCAVDLSFTHRGPIISGLTVTDNNPMKIKWLGNDYMKGLKELGEIALSMSWSGYDNSDEVRSVYLLNRAGGWAEFRSGLKEFRSISQNFAYADADGNIGLNAGGGIPIRKGNGIMIRSGETGDYDRKGYVPFDQLPHTFNPPDGQISSANNKSVGDDYPYFISNSFDLPYRINRIREMLDEKERLSTEDFKRMITDQHSDFARLLTPYILRIKNMTAFLTPTGSQALDALSEWDYGMDTGLAAPAIFEFFRLSFKRNLLADELEELYDQLWDISGDYYIYRILNNGADEWVDNIKTANKETIDDIVLQSFLDCIKIMTDNYGKYLEDWEWGKIHTITLMHPLGTVKILDHLFNLNSDKFSIGGSDHTVCPYFSFGNDFKANLGASVRLIYDTSDWDESYTVIPGGVSGVPGSEFYLSQLNSYLEGKFYRDHYSDEDVRRSAKYRLSLKPE